MQIASKPVNRCTIISKANFLKRDIIFKEKYQQILKCLKIWQMENSKILLAYWQYGKWQAFQREYWQQLFQQEVHIPFVLVITRDNYQVSNVQVHRTNPRFPPGSSFCTSAWFARPSMVWAHLPTQCHSRTPTGHPQA